MPPPFCGKENIHAIIETPKNSRNKFAYDNKSGMFLLKKSCPAGLSFPLDFGFIPNTKADDGDPMDVLVFMEEPVFQGCILECKVIGVLIAEQDKNGKRIRNDRILAVAKVSKLFERVETTSDVGKQFMKELVSFFEIYHQQEDNHFKVLEVADAKEAIKLIKENLHYEPA